MGSEEETTLTLDMLELTRAKLDELLITLAEELITLNDELITAASLDSSEALLEDGAGFATQADKATEADATASARHGRLIN